MWDLSLVDPDNRRPVDFSMREELLAGIDQLLEAEPAERQPALRAMLRDWPDGRIKLLLTAAGLRLRREKPDVFLEGEYVPLVTEITVPGGAVAFARIAPPQQGKAGDAVLFVAPRLCAPIVDSARPFPVGGECWRTSRLMLPPELRERSFRHVLTGAELRPTAAGEAAWLFFGEIFDTVPIGILVSVSSV